MAAASPMATPSAAFEDVRYCCASIDCGYVGGSDSHDYSTTHE